MSELANEFRMSDVGLAKRCRSVDVPIPYRGYWARKATGQDPADWAAAYADQLDPLSASPRNPDQGPAPTDSPRAQANDYEK